MKRQILTSIFIAFATFCSGQTDTIFSNNEKIPCSVIEITQEAVKFTYPEEELVNSVYKNSVQKIIFKNGRVQTFVEATSFKIVRGVDDFENVTITQVESEVKGLFKLGEVSSKAKGASTLSNQERVKERAYRKLKIGAALMGANIIFLTDQRTEGNKIGGYYQSGSTAETNLTGVVYSNQLPNYDEFKKMIDEENNFIATQESKLWSNASDMETKVIQKSFVISGIENENGIIILNGELQDETKIKTFRVVSFDNEFFNIYFEDKSTAYNVKVKI
jgi:hypothetical protein